MVKVMLKYLKQVMAGLPTINIYLFFKILTALDVKNLLNWSLVFLDSEQKVWKVCKELYFFAKLIFFSVLHGYPTTLCVKQLR